MKRLWILSCLWLLAAPAGAQQDAFDLAAAQIVNAPDVRDWPITTAITSVSFDGATTRVDFTKHNGPNRWPDSTLPGWDGPLQYTLWLFVKNGDQWVGSGFIQFWQSRDGSGSAADPDVPSVYHEHWYYAARWSPIYGHGPIQPGESIGFMVTPGGGARDNGPVSLRERSNVVVFSATDRGTFTFAADAPPVTTPPAPPVTPPGPANPPAFDLHDILVQLQAIDRRLDELRAQSDANTEKVQQQIDQAIKNLEKSTPGLVQRIVQAMTLGIVR